MEYCCLALAEHFDPLTVKIDILNPQPDTLHEPQPGAI